MNNDRALLIYHKKLNIWIPPGGHIDDNETPDEAVERECKEELNLEIEVLNRNNVSREGNIVKQLAVPFYVNVHNVGDHNHCCFFYLCKPRNPEQIQINRNELKTYKWFSREEIDQQFIPIDVRNIAKKAFNLLDNL